MLVTAVQMKAQPLARMWTLPGQDVLLYQLLVARREAPHNHADQADIGCQNLRFFRPRGLSAAPLCKTNQIGSYIDEGFLLCH
ncbi:MAG: hypothetical protein KDJ34_03685 [Candidatus Competibacteraceae bacterium]|nr:hypothetical protein [Candidatus Competibacteraceae bacterium]